MVCGAIPGSVACLLLHKHVFEGFGVSFSVPMATSKLAELWESDVNIRVKAKDLELATW